MFGNWLMINQCFEDADEKLMKALELDEEGCFGSHYTLANMMNNSVDIEKVNMMKFPEKFQAKAVMERCQHHLKKYLDFAPIGHWHVHRACITLIHTNTKLTARGSESLESLEKRQPGFCAEQLALFERGVVALKLHVKCFGREQSDFKFIYKQAASMVSRMHKLGLAGNSTMPECEYICGNPACTKDGGVTPLKECSRCQSVRYCCKNCQVSHWKNGHKKDCKRLKKEYSELQKIKKMKRFDVEMDQKGDTSTESEMDSLFDD